MLASLVAYQHDFPSDRPHVAMGQNSVPPVNIPIPTKISSKMGGAPTPKMVPLVLTHSHVAFSYKTQPLKHRLLPPENPPARPTHRGHGCGPLPFPGGKGK